MNKTDMTLIDLLDEVAIDFHMFGALMEGRFGRQMDGRLIITENHGRRTSISKSLSNAVSQVISLALAAKD